MNDRIFKQSEEKDFQETVLKICSERNFDLEVIESIRDYFLFLNKYNKTYFEYKIFLRSFKNDVPVDIYRTVDVEKRGENIIIYQAFDCSVGSKILVVLFNKD